MSSVCELVTNNDAAPADHRDRLQTMLSQSRACFETLVRLYYLRHGYEYANTYLTHHLTVLAFNAITQLALAAPPPTASTPNSDDSASASASTTNAPAPASNTVPTSTSTPSTSSPSNSTTNTSSACNAPNPTTRSPNCSSPTTDEARSALLLAAKGLHDQARNYYTPLTLFHLVRSQMSVRDENILLGLTTAGVESEQLARQRARYVQAQYPVAVVSMVNHPDKGRLEDLVREYAGLAIEEGKGAPSSG